MFQTSRPRIFAVLAVGVGLIVASFAGSGRTADDPPSSPRTVRKDPIDSMLKDFMREKLAASSQVLEGLTTDDMTLVIAGARRLDEISQAERWWVTNDPIYRQFSGEFREITQQLIKAAEAGNPDRVAVKWMDATISCLDCHRFVRGIHIAGE